MNKDNGGPAFPVDGDTHAISPFHGMSLRDYFAAHAPSVPVSWRGGAPVDAADIIDWRWYYADAMLADRNKC